MDAFFLTQLRLERVKMAYYKSLENQLEYSFHDVHLLNEAFVAAGAVKSRPDVEGDVSGNKRLALIGDAVLRLSILEEWFPSGESTGKYK